VSFLWKLNKPVPIEIEIGPSDGNFVVVSKGLSGGEKLLLHDPRKVLVNESGS
jgi:hypothetical protein